MEALTEITANIRSLEAIPAAFITDFERTSLVQLARAGEDVYAYHPANGDVDDQPTQWNVWIVDRRLCLRKREGQA